MDKTSYVLGFMFNEEKEKVLLIRKNRPDFQKEKLNGIGGKIENSVRVSGNISPDLPESPLQAMVREFYEETGFYWDSWEKVCDVMGEDWHIEVFKAFGDINKARTVTDEEVCIVDINNLPKNIMSNLSWLIPMALQKDKYIIKEL